jgi:hypothetical protein
VRRLDETTLAVESARPRRGSHPSDVRPHWCEACRETHAWCDTRGSLSCRHVLRTVAALRFV